MEHYRKMKNQSAKDKISVTATVFSFDLVRATGIAKQTTTVISYFALL